MKLHLAIYYYIKFYKQKKNIELVFKKNIHSKIDEIKILSFNGRSLSFSILEKKTKKKYFLKKILFLDKEYVYYKINDIIDKKYKFVSILYLNNLISYKSFKLIDNTDIFLREFIDGFTFTEKIKFLKTGEIKETFEIIIDYILKVFSIMRKNKLYVNIDLKPDNLIFGKNDEINLIDLDLIYIDLDEKNFEAFILAKFFFKTIPFLKTSDQKTLFDTIEKKINFVFDFKRFLLDRFFSSENNVLFNNFIFENFNYFKNIKISFDKTISIKNKFKESINSLPNHTYIIARRYNWLINDNHYDSKDIDIICNEIDIENIKNTFQNNGWDINKNKISQYFERENLLVNIDLETKNKLKFGLSFQELYNKSEIIGGIRFISEVHYHNIMIQNLLKFKKFIKSDYFEELKKYSKKNKILLKNYQYLFDKFYIHHNKVFFYKYELFKRVLIDFIKQKNIAFIGADGAGKSTIVKIVNQNISLYVSTRKTYLSSFFYPSGRTDMFFFKTSFIFKYFIFIKKKLFIKLNNDNNSLQYKNDIIFFSNLRSMKKLKSIYMQIILFFFIPIFVFDAWIHKIINYFSAYRINICDRYYDDILINFTNTKIRKFLKYLIPNSRNKFYLYATPEEHFNRKKNEEIEMIIHMQKCYTENKKYLKSFPTNINQTLITKKIIKMVLKSL